jgi:GT2 family glycosyltransferase
MIDLSIAIVSWKMRGMLCDLLHSITRNSRDLTYQIIVVDNNSQDGTVEMIRDEFPSVVLIENPENRGVAPSRNQALKVAKGRYVLILDADTLLLENSFKKMIEFMDRTPDAGICSCKLISANHVVQPNARRYPSLLAFVLRRLTFIGMLRDHPVLNRHEMTDWDRSDIRDVDYVIGACQMIRDAARVQVGMLDEKIFYGPEDIDYCLRMYRKGWKVYYYPHTSIIHYEQRITKRKMFSKISYRHFLGIVHLFSKYGWRLTRT